MIVLFFRLVLGQSFLNFDIQGLFLLISALRFLLDVFDSDLYFVKLFIFINNLFTLQANWWYIIWLNALWFLIQISFIPYFIRAHENFYGAHHSCMASFIMRCFVSILHVWLNSITLHIVLQLTLPLRHFTFEQLLIIWFNYLFFSLNSALPWFNFWRINFSHLHLRWWLISIYWIEFWIALI